jgi:peptide-methionine (S)-S-oxide reductase
MGKMFLGTQWISSLQVPVFLAVTTDRPPALAAESIRRVSEPVIDPILSAKAANLSRGEESNMALPNRNQPMAVAPQHVVLGTPMQPPAEILAGLEAAMFGMGCFWGVEKRFWEAPVYTTAVGYAAGTIAHPSYPEVCTGETGHVEVVRVLFHPEKISYEALLKIFWESHDPTQGMRQGNDTGSQYRSGIYTYTDAQQGAAKASRDAYERVLAGAGYGRITTEIRSAPEFYFAEDYHQQYLAKNPTGYCGMSGTGLALPAGAAGPRQQEFQIG